MAQLDNTRVAILATDGVEQVELTEPKKALEQAGAKVDVISNKSGSIQGFNNLDKSDMIPVDLTLDKANPSNYDALLLPGGALNADFMRAEPRVQQFVKAMSSKPMAVICHAPWELVSAGLVKGKTLTSYYTIQDDIRNAGGNWVDREVVVDGNLVTSRQPSDIPMFNREMLQLFSRRPTGATR